MHSTFDQGRYAVLGCIGHGGSADVYAVVDEKLGIERAVKVPRERPDAAEVARLEREAAVLLRLDHPGILRVFDTFDLDGRPCLVMERCEGSLEERVAREGPLPVEAALDLGETLRAALDAVHAAGVLHRDVKPANVLFTPAGQPRLADFGVALTQRDPGSLTRTGAVLGTVAFMAPAVRRGEPESEATDRYGLAATVAYAVLGTLPGDVDRPAVRRGLPAPVADWVAGLLAGDMELEPVASGAVPGPRRSPAAWATGLGLLGAGLAVGAWVGRGTAPVPPAAEADPSAVADALQPCDALPGRINWRSMPGDRETLTSDLLDVDQDGHPDALFVSQLDESLQVLRGGPGVGVEGVHVLDVGRGSVAPTLIDLDQDGRSEVILPERDDARLRVLWMGDDLQPTRTELVDQAGPMEHAQAVDMDSDGINDLVGPTDFGRHLAWRRVPGDGTLEPARLILSVKDVAVRDMLGRDMILEEAGAWSWRRLTPGGGLEFLRDVPPGAFLLGLPGGVGVVDRDGRRMLRLDAPPCGLGDLGDFLTRGGRLGRRVADWNADGVPDVVGSRTCQGCTSQLMLGLGLERGGE